MNTSHKPLRPLKLASAAEAITLATLVCIAMPLKHIVGYSFPVSILGPIHGMAFLAFVWVLINAASSGDLSRPEIWRLLLASVIPFGGFFSVSWIARRESEH